MFLLTGIVGYFMLRHAVQGWSRPLKYCGKWAFEPRRNINEKTAIKLSRGDFDQKPENAADLLKAIENETRNRAICSVFYTV
jgi:hypothetical protein